MRVLVIGGYGLIGREIVRALRLAGHQVTGLGRSAARGRRLAPEIPWMAGDLARMTRPEDWAAAVSDIDAVVNASGALQDGLRDNLALVQDRSIRALIAACERQGVKRYVQISAPGAHAAAPTAFLRTKAAADAALRSSALDWTILKPGLVIGAGAYGGTALIRMLAALPLVQPVVLASARIQTVSAADVADAVRAALAGDVASGRDYDLVEAEPHTLLDLVHAVRRWVGREDARWTWRLPRWFAGAIGRLADVAGWLGWRSPLRTTALRALTDGVTGDPGPWMASGGRPMGSLAQTLAALPSTMQERVFGRAQLVYPALLLMLAAFWIASGVIGLVRIDAAAAMIAGKVGEQAATGLVGLGSALDLAIGVGLLLRKWVRVAAWASILVSAGYLAAGSFLTPELWADPLGPLVKVFPAIALALAVVALTEER